MIGRGEPEGRERRWLLAAAYYPKMVLALFRMVSEPLFRVASMETEMETPRTSPALVLRTKKQPKIVTTPQALAWAQEKSRLVNFTYLGTADQTAARRCVEALGQVVFSGQRYLYAFDRDREQNRIFRLDRMEHVTVTLKRHSVRPYPEPVTQVNYAMTRRTTGLAVSVLLANSSPLLLEPGTVSPAWRLEHQATPKGWTRLVFWAPDTANALARLTRLDSPWRLEGPPEVTSRWTSLLQNAGVSTV
ncbi:MAG: WYL domain-containing protein [Bifidobacteriaceae bacterium]|nr:WYL domain-containing protein [Bifidobacteriaceae bacterium]